MPASLLQYEMLPTTWFFVSSLIIVAAFFKFNRFLSIRNIDVVGLILLTPGQLLLAMKNDQSGYNWLLWIACIFCVRMFYDIIMVRRPLLEPNLTPGGLVFACVALFAFLIASVAINRGEQIDSLRTVRLEQMLTVMVTSSENQSLELHSVEPGYPPFWALARRTQLLVLPSQQIRHEIVDEPVYTSLFSLKPTRPRNRVKPSQPLTLSQPQEHDLLAPLPASIPNTITTETTLDRSDSDDQIVYESNADIELTEQHQESVTRNHFAIPLITVSVLGHLFIVLGLIFVGHCHFGSIRTGIACAMLYLLVPYTNQMIARPDHVIPAAAIVWAFVVYRRPFFAGMLISAASVLVFYPIFLLPLWFSFYWKRGWVRFLIGIVASIVILIAVLPAFPESRVHFGEHLYRIIGGTAFTTTHPNGFWQFHNPIYRIPVIAAFLVVCTGLFLWPTHKHLATLLSCSALIMLGVQLWQPHEGGLFIAWYLPLVILTIFRPNLEDRVALATVVE
ncbi:MAG: hypothetical protein LBU65_14765 [Planctomycetaceae bacterium]|jgi:hypothetical protein|nr:hypothetical protein [Planctomycetaceae bacterium]